MTSEPFQQTGVARRDESRETRPDTGPAEIGSTQPEVLPIRGGRAARARGAILRRVLAISDWASLAGGRAVADLLVSGPPVHASSIALSAAFGPAWILAMKLHGLYDLDHRRIRHS